MAQGALLHPQKCARERGPSPWAPLLPANVHAGKRFCMHGCYYLLSSGVVLLPRQEFVVYTIPADPSTSLYLLLVSGWQDAALDVIVLSTAFSVSRQVTDG